MKRVGYAARPRRFVHRLIAAALACALGGAPASAAAEEAEAPPCGVPAELLQHNPPLANSARALGGGRLTVVVWGTRSSTDGASGTSQAYPAHLRASLARHYPSADIRVEVVSQPGHTAVRMLRNIGAVQALRPDLVIWQTGTADAVRNASLQQFGRAVARGLKSLRERGADVILMDMQYGPYTELLTNAKPYRGYLWWVSRRENVGLMPRYQVMEHWSEQGRFDLATEDRDLQRANADAIHACLGETLGWMIADAVERARP
ncbi:SGNH/GDSL hydrolase family protein [Pseudothauera rhizosphaerae]|uniref:SGNH/GDSL hydrolase family protein n=1 Tax=Pseudothauera rhizosphaerae TaxID=2565932 RepID=A0A4S4APK2_9RHOO|nr:SGNH/GDSL hydrolase family protein [Pseudothauera rhizosphaerae]THF61623.1 SGNH/GDSL hydrolase family protein [Pseudothauera rhizosphaerae]